MQNQRLLKTLNPIFNSKSFDPSHLPPIVYHSLYCLPSKVSVIDLACNHRFTVSAYFEGQLYKNNKNKIKRRKEMEIRIQILCRQYCSFQVDCKLIMRSLYIPDFQLKVSRICKINCIRIKYWQNILYIIFIYFSSWTAAIQTVGFSSWTRQTKERAVV
jgi:hypothetical protein